MVPKLSNYVGGRPVASRTERYGSVYDPARGVEARQVPLSTAEDVADAVAVARAAFEGWAATPPVRRARVMFALKALIDRDMDQLASLVTSEHGKVL
jgi:malonate-semialdehyde dehydrogenase (acetylating) / methylmalonate-semialdehyde dehydrogenase